MSRDTWSKIKGSISKERRYYKCFAVSAILSLWLITNLESILIVPLIYPLGACSSVESNVFRSTESCVAPKDQMTTCRNNHNFSEEDHFTWKYLLVFVIYLLVFWFQFGFNPNDRTNNGVFFPGIFLTAFIFAVLRWTVPWSWVALDHFEDIRQKRWYAHEMTIRNDPKCANTEGEP